MKSLTEKQLAEKILKIKREGYPSWTQVLFGKSKIHFLRWILLILLLLALFNIKDDTQSIRFLCVLLGFLIGGIVKEAFFVKQIADNWHFTNKVTDWTKVEALSKEESTPPPLPPEGTGRS